MSFSPSTSADSDQRGATLIELMMALVVLALGVLAVAQVFPAGTRSQIKDSLMSSASYYAQETIEDVGTMTWSDPNLAPGRHPPGAAEDSLGTLGTWRRHYDVADMAAPLDNLRKVTVTVSWNHLGNARQVTATTYVRR